MSLPEGRAGAHAGRVPPPDTAPRDLPQQARSAAQRALRLTPDRCTARAVHKVDCAGETVGRGSPVQMQMRAQPRRAVSALTPRI
jgi:hypothetical protein